jgi:ubiquinone/menaquinone biosynthesis C-methylase UbiE
MAGHRLYAALYDFGVGLAEKRLAPLRDLVAGDATGRVLEIGCGTGANLAYYRWAALESLEATEPDRFMLARAETKARKLPLLAREKLRLSQAPAESLPFADGHFDAVVATLVLCSVAQPEQALREIRRVLKPGGVLRLLEHVRGQGTEARIQRIVQPVYGPLAADCHLDRPTEALLTAADFRLEVLQRPRLGPLFPAFVGLAQA